MGFASVANNPKSLWLNEVRLMSHYHSTSIAGRLGALFYPRTQAGGPARLSSIQQADGAAAVTLASVAEEKRRVPSLGLALLKASVGWYHLSLLSFHWLKQVIVHL